MRWENGEKRLSTVIEIVAAWLRANGYDGLYYDGPGEEGCGCGVDDLRPCDDDMSACKAGYRCTISEGEHRFEGIGPVRDGEDADA